jgi:hypothetical protein
MNNDAPSPATGCGFIYDLSSVLGFLAQLQVFMFVLLANKKITAFFTQTTR